MLQQWVLGSGQIVVDRFNSHLHESVTALLSEALAKVQLSGVQFAVEQVNFDRIVGETTCVETHEGDQIVYAQRPKRFGLSRFVKNRQPESCKSVVVILKKAEDGDYFVLITAFIGVRPEPEPWDRNATPKSKDFWSTHALVWNSEPTISGTETTRCPW
jgi:hypothetical protein